MPPVDDVTHLAVLRFYARQSHLIDGADAQGWARTFTADGTFDSPSYDRPVRGHDELVAFAKEFTRRDIEAGVRTRHVVTTVDPRPVQDRKRLNVFAYLQIVETPLGEPSRLLRHTVIDDDLLLTEDGPRVVARRVLRDDQPAE